MNQLAFRIVRRRYLHAYRQAIGASSRGNGQRRIAAGVVDHRERHRVVHVRHGPTFHLDRRVLGVVSKCWPGRDWTDDEVVFVETALQLLDELHSSFEGSTETLEVETQTGLHRPADVDGDAFPHGAELTFHQLADYPRRALTENRAEQESPQVVGFLQPLVVERSLPGLHACGVEPAHERRERLFRPVTTGDVPHIVEPCDLVVLQGGLGARLGRTVEEVLPRGLVHDRPRQLDVDHRSRERADARHRDESFAAVRRRRYVPRPVDRDVLRRLQPEHAAEMRGHTNGAADVAADLQGREACGDGRGPAAGAAAGSTRHIVGVVGGRVERPERLVIAQHRWNIRLTKDAGACFFQPLDDQGVGRSDVVLELREIDRRLQTRQVE